MMPTEEFDADKASACKGNPPSGDGGYQKNTRFSSKESSAFGLIPHFILAIAHRCSTLCMSSATA
jgi:hypothetical protein